MRFVCLVAALVTSFLVVDPDPKAVLQKSAEACLKVKAVQYQIREEAGDNEEPKSAERSAYTGMQHRENELDVLTRIHIPPSTVNPE